MTYIRELKQIQCLQSVAYGDSNFDRSSLEGIVIFNSEWRWVWRQWLSEIFSHVYLIWLLDDRHGIGAVQKLQKKGSLQGMIAYVSVSHIRGRWGRILQAKFTSFTKRWIFELLLLPETQPSCISWRMAGKLVVLVLQCVLQLHEITITKFWMTLYLKTSGLFQIILCSWCIFHLSAGLKRISRWFTWYSWQSENREKGNKLLYCTRIH